MHGHGYAPPPPTRRANGGQVVLRVVFVTLTLLSCGFLGWAPMLRLALLTGKRQHWWVFGGVLASTVGFVVYAGFMVPTGDNEPLSDPVGVTILLWLLCATVGVTTYYLVGEIRHFERAAPVTPAYVPPQPQPQVSGYGFPPVAPQPPVPTPPAQNPYAQPVQQPYTPPVQQPPVAEPQQHARIDQVRAELDELSDLLRRDRNQREGDR